MNPFTLRACTRQAFRDVRAFDASSYSYAAATKSSRVTTPCRSAFAARSFSTTMPAQSRIGAVPVTIPKDVTFEVYDLPKSAITNAVRGQEVPTMGVKVKGPLGTLKLTLPSFSKLDYNEETRRVTFSVLDVMDKKQKSMWGTIRQLFNNTVLGVSEGHISILRMVGVGFRATVEPIKTAATTNIKEEFPDQQFINLKVGYAHPIELPVPRGIKASTPQPTMILLEGTEKQAVKQFAAEIREWRRPEPYKGKGIFVDEETIRLKAKKIK